MEPSATGNGRWRLAAGLVLLSAVMVLALTIWFIARDDGDRLAAQQNAVAIVEAPDGPDRVKPKDPGGEDVPDQDKQVFETFQSEQDREQPVVERLLPAAEQPLPEPVPAPMPASEPEPVTEVTVAPRPEPEAKPAETAADPVSKPEPQPQPVKKSITDIVVKGNAAPAPSPAAIPADDGAEAWRVQLAALRDESAAAQTWQTISSRQKALLGTLQPSISRVETEGRGTFYRLRVGAFPTKAEAEALCSALKKAGQDCLVAKG